MSYLRVFVATAAVLVGVNGAVPSLLHFQGRILSQGAVFDGNGRFKFALVDGVGATAYWLSSPDGNADGAPDAAVELSVNRGLYSVLLGDSSIANMSAINPEIFGNPDVRLRIWFDDGVNGFQLLSPDQRVAAAGYALMAATVPDGSVTAEKLQAGVLSASNIGGVFDSSQIPALDAGKISSGTLDPARLPSGVALKDPDLLGTSNSLGAKIALLTTQISELASHLAAISNDVQAALPAGTVLASSTENDAALLSNGFASFSTVAAPVWTDASTDGALTARSGHGSAWTGSELLIWGGLVGAGQDSAQGAAYNPATDQWRLLSTTSAPAQRSGHSAIWTGNEFLVWGGYSTLALDYVNTGARIESAGALWTALPTGGAPTGRDGHVAIWTGDRLVIWGGKSFDGILADGGIYHRGNNQWSALNLANAPGARFGAAAAWAGDRILIWGGEGDSGALGTGAQLLFNAGTPSAWQPIAALNAPSARTGHRSVWTGSRLLVWGGRNGGAYFDNGASYDPIANTWEPLTANGAPAPREGHVAIWTGTEMVVFGGQNAGGALASGGAYNPATETWRPLTSEGNPRARSDAVAAWTGSELLVFGGQAGGIAQSGLQKVKPEPAWHLYRKL